MSRLHSSAISLSALIAFAPSISTAVPAAYTINFAVNQSNPSGGTPIGSFTYDSVTALFNNFIISWNGLTFNTTAAANNGPIIYGAGCGIPHTAAGSFSFLSGANTSACPIVRSWYSGNSSGSVYFNFSTQDYDYSLNAAVLFNNPAYTPGSPNASSGGTFTISAVPEATAGLMWATGLVAIGLLARLDMQRRSSCSS